MPKKRTMAESAKEVATIFVESGEATKKLITRFNLLPPESQQKVRHVASNAATAIAIGEVAEFEKIIDVFADDHDKEIASCMALAFIILAYKESIQGQGKILN